MAEPFLGEIRLCSFAFAPKGWALCNGQLLSINQNQALFSLLGTTFGGDGRTNFALPDLRGRSPIQVGGGHVLGERGGEASHTVTVAELPAHTHTMQAKPANADSGTPNGDMLAGVPSYAYGSPTSLTALIGGTLANSGGSQAHQNLQPYLVLNFCIALQGIFPSQN